MQHPKNVDRDGAKRQTATEINWINSFQQHSSSACFTCSSEWQKCVAANWHLHGLCVFVVALSLWSGLKGITWLAEGTKAAVPATKHGADRIFNMYLIGGFLCVHKALWDAFGCDLDGQQIKVDWVESLLFKACCFIPTHFPSSFPTAKLPSFQFSPN